MAGRQADLARSQSRFRLAGKTYTRWQELARAGAISGQDLDESQADYESAQAAVDAAQAAVQSAEADVQAATAAVQSRIGDQQAAQADEAAAAEKVTAAIANVRSSQATVASMAASLNASRAGVRAATATIQASQADVNRVGAIKGFQQVLAPFSGVITARNVNVGDMIDPGATTSLNQDPTATVPHTGLFGIARTDVLRIQVNVPEDAARDMRIGSPARILVQEFPHTVFTGTVFDKAGAIDASSRTQLVEVRVSNPTGRLVPGMFAEVRFQLHTARPLLEVPANTLIIDANGTRVATVTPDDRVHFVIVQLGRDYGNRVEVVSGLNGDERLISDPTDILKEGDEVKVVR